MTDAVPKETGGGPAGEAERPAQSQGPAGRESTPPAAKTADRPAEPSELSGEASEDGGPSVGDAEDVASHGGSATQRGDARSDARATLIYGDQVGGHKYVINLKGRSAPLRKVPHWDREPVEFAFASPEGQQWEELKRDFGNRRSRLLRARTGAGKSAVALHLLGVGIQPRQVYELPPDADITKLAELVERSGGEEGGVERGAGFLMSDPQDLARLRGPVLRGLEDALASAEAQLVITVTSDFVPADADLLDHVLDLHTLAGHREIVAKHLRWRLSGLEANELLADPELDELISELVATNAPRKRAGDLALFVKRATAARKTDMARVRELMERNKGEDFDIWFHGLTDDERCFAVALAVFNRLSYQKISAAAQALRKRLKTSSTGAPKTSDRGSAVSRAAGERLHDLRAETTDVYMRGAFGRVTGEGIQYTDGKYPRRVVERFWKHYDAAEHFLAWLQDLAEDPSEPVRIRAATAMGLVATFSFEHLHDRVFARWAIDEKPERREAVANALGVAADSPRLLGTILRMVEDWHANGNTEARATAARVYGVIRGQDLPWALDRLGRLLTIRAAPIWRAVGDSLSDLTYVEDDYATEAVLEALCRWLCNYRREITGQIAFLNLTVAHVTEMPEGDTGAPVLWPTVLVRADRNHVIRERLVSLWARVYEGWWWHRTSERVLSDWATMAEADGDMRKVFVSFFGAMSAAGGRTLAMLRRLVDDWGSDDYLVPLPKTVGAIRDSLGWPPSGMDMKGSRE